MVNETVKTSRHLQSAAVLLKKFIRCSLSTVLEQKPELINTQGGTFGSRALSLEFMVRANGLF